MGHFIRAKFAAISEVTLKLTEMSEYIIIQFANNVYYVKLDG